MKRQIIIAALILVGLSILSGCGGGTNKNDTGLESDLRTKPTTDFTLFKRKF